MVGWPLLWPSNLRGIPVYYSFIFEIKKLFNYDPAKIVDREDTSERIQYLVQSRIGTLSRSCTISFMKKDSCIFHVTLQ